MSDAEIIEVRIDSLLILWHEGRKLTTAMVNRIVPDRRGQLAKFFGRNGVPRPGVEVAIDGGGTTIFPASSVGERIAQISPNQRLGRKRVEVSLRSAS